MSDRETPPIPSEHPTLQTGAAEAHVAPRKGEGMSDAETFLLLAQSSSRVGLWSWDPTSDTVWHSTEMYRLHGVSPGGLGNRLEDYLSFIHPDDRVRVSEAAWRAVTGDTFPLEYRFVHPEGGVRHLLAHSALVRDRTDQGRLLIGTVQDVTEIMMARQNVSSAIARLSAYFDEMPTSAYLFRKEDGGLVLRRLNKTATERWGESAPRLLGRTAEDLLPDRPDMIADLYRCLETQRAFARDMEFGPNTLGVTKAVMTYVPVAPDSVVAHASDMSLVLTSSQREEIATARLAEYFQRVPTPAYLWREKDGRIVLEAANHAGWTATEGRVERIIGVAAEDVYPDRPDVVADLERAFAGETFTREMKYTPRFTDRVQDLVVTYVHIPPDAVAAHTRDVTQERLMEEEVRESHESARGIMEGSPDGTCLIVDGRISACNASLSNLVGCEREALIGRRLHDLMLPEDRERAMQRGQAILDGARPKPAEYTLLRCDGTRLPVEIYSAALDFRGNPALVCTLRDVSGRKDAEQELAESHDALRALTQHLESVREQERVQVARDLHDELGSVLTALKIDLAEAMSAETSDVGHERCIAMARLVDQAIEVGRRVTARLRPGILDDLGLAAAAEWLASDLEKRTGMRCRVTLPEVEPQLPEPVATTMFRILQEALTNVMRHAGADCVGIELQADESTVALTVSDNGKGFDPSGPEGSGFGLLGMRERVRSFGGTFEVVSAPGEGAWIRVALPLAQS